MLQFICRLALMQAGVLNRVEVMVGSANESIDALAGRGQRFDIAFLDADKTGYLGYYKQLMDSQLIVPGGIIVVDNALMKVRPPASQASAGWMASLNGLDDETCSDWHRECWLVGEVMRSKVCHW